ncbi:hypothetical protein [Asticcacaulis sp. AC402]|uniref:hypothetical protein n=1 Tax=Asticcacaulis sp. AC402 TaxID=1282361 RepID=UPI0003C3CE4E|nr:hypothetical protein [Asticcacaulis sp. AC402]ESQ76169.1 hypothetical protein ABAC402_06880 [Asticcacaulis sp. AC402]
MTAELHRRHVLQTAAALASTLPATAADAQAVGKAGDFDFLTGEWRIKNRQLKNADTGEWIEFDGEATVVSILKGVVSVEELRIPARDFSGMGLRVLDIEQKVWKDYWVNAKSGALGSEGVPGVFSDGAGVFDSVDPARPSEIWRGVWDQITPTSCRWYQAVSKDGGKTWQDNWIMAWTRI